MEDYIVISDKEHIYTPNQKVRSNDVITDYCDCYCTNDETLQDWLWNIPTEQAMKFIGESWGVEFKKN